MTVSGLKTKQIKDDWWHASGYDANALDAHNTSYWTCGPTEDEAVAALIIALLRNAKVTK